MVAMVETCSPAPHKQVPLVTRIILHSIGYQTCRSHIRVIWLDRMSSIQNLAISSDFRFFVSWTRCHVTWFSIHSNWTRFSAWLQIYHRPSVGHSTTRWTKTVATTDDGAARGSTVWDRESATEVTGGKGLAATARGRHMEEAKIKTRPLMRSR